MKAWLRLGARVLIFVMGLAAAFLWMLRGFQAFLSNQWAHPIMGGVFCMCVSFGVVLLTVWAMFDPLNEGLPRKHEKADEEA